MHYKGYLIDLDGTMYLGNEKIPSGTRFISRLQKEKIPFLFLTNNSTKTSEMVAKRLKEAFDIHVTKEHVYTSSLATVDYLKEDGKGKKVYVIGEKGLKKTLFDAGFSYEEEHPDYVVVGLDTDVTYEKVVKAVLAIQKGATFIGTNPDKNIPTERGMLPSAGAIIDFVQSASHVEPIIIGKPESIIMEKALHRLGLEKKEVAMIGDNYATDICAGIHYDMDTLLVLTGFTKESDLLSLPIAPTHVVHTLDEWTI